MTLPRNRNGRNPTLRFVLATIVVAFGVSPVAGMAAQEATPVPASSPVAGDSCGERLGIGDASVACLTIIHGSADAGPIDVGIDGAILFTGVAFGSSTGFVALPAGTHDIRVTATSQSDVILLDSPEQRFTPGEGVEVAIVGSRDASTLNGLTLPIQADAPAAGTASLRVVQGIPDAPPLDIALASGETVISALTPLTASDYLTVPAAATSINILAAGSPDVLFPVPDFSAPDGATVTVYALGSVTNPTGIVLLTVLVPGLGEESADLLMSATPAA